MISDLADFQSEVNTEVLDKPRCDGAKPFQSISECTQYCHVLLRTIAGSAALEGSAEVIFKVNSKAFSGQVVKEKNPLLKFCLH